MGVLAFVATVTLLCCAVCVPGEGAVLGDSVGAAGVGQSLWGWGRGHTHDSPVASGIASSCAFHGEATTAWAPETTASPCPHPRSKRGRQEVERLLSVSADEFAAQVYERQPLVRLRNDVTHFAALRDLAHPRFLSRLELLKASKNGNVTARKGQVSGIAERPRDHGVPPEAEEAVARRLRSGETIVANEIQELNDALSNTTSALAKLTGVSWNANLYLTPPGETGFTPHWDWTDSLIVHVAGRKLWKVCNGEALGLSPGLPNRVEDDEASAFHNQFTLERLQAAERAYLDTDAAASAGDQSSVRIVTDGGEVAGGWPCTDVLLTPGSVLYMPRGTVHAPRALNADETPGGAVHVTDETGPDTVEVGMDGSASHDDAGVQPLSPPGSSFHITIGLPARQFSWYDVLQSAADTVETAAQQFANVKVLTMLRKQGGPGVARATDAVPYSITLSRLVYELLKHVEAHTPYVRRRFPVSILRRESGKHAWQGEKVMRPGVPRPATGFLGTQRRGEWAYIRQELGAMLHHFFGAPASLPPAHAAGVEGASVDAVAAVADVCNLRGALQGDEEDLAAAGAVVRLVRMYLGPLLKSAPGGEGAAPGEWHRKWPPLPIDAAVRDVVDVMLEKSQKLRTVRRDVSKKGLLHVATS